MGRRWGKSVLAGSVALATAGKMGGHVAWCVPTYKNGRAPWRWIEQTVAGIRKAGKCRVNKSERTVEFDNGGFIGLYSMDNEDSIRSESFNLVILDEAAKMSESAWTDAIQPTLADVDGDAIIIGTPYGRNWFWREYQAGLADGKRQASFHAPSSDNPNPMIKRAAMLAKKRVPERTYRQEWLAEFVEDGGGVFRRVMEAATAPQQDEAVDGHDYVFGVDWGKSNDYTAMAVIDATTQQCCYLDRSNQVDYSLQVARLMALCDRFHPAGIIAERNSMGEPLIEALQRADLPVIPFTTTNATKANIIDGLALAFEQGELQILADAVLLGELQAYEMETLPSGLTRYSAPDGMHDDTVMALAMAWSGVREYSQPLLAFAV